MFYGCSRYGFGGFGGGAFMMIIPIILLGLIIYFLFKKMDRPGYSESRDGSEALNILMERFAQGEISEDEYLSKKKLLKR